MASVVVENGAEFVKKLAASGTGERTLELCRDFLAFTHRKENRIATALEVYEAMETNFERNGWPGEMTFDKSRQIIETGTWVGPVSEKVTPVEELLLRGSDLPPEVLPPPVEAMKEEFDAEEVREEKKRATIELSKVKKKPGKETKPKWVPKEKTKPTAKAQPDPTKFELEQPAQVPVVGVPEPVGATAGTVPW